jgi:hypothetical protein
MQRTLLLLLIVVALGGLAYYLTVAGGEAEIADERAFAISQTDRIHHIRIADRQGNDVSLERGGPTGWLADGRPAGENVMKNLLQAVGQITVQSVPTSRAVPNLVKNLASGGILVQLYDRNGDKLRGYYIGGGANGERGTIAIMEGSENPYIVHLPMWTGNLRHRFNLRGDEWRSKQYFAVDPARVEYLSIEYPKQRDQSFRLLRDEDGAFRVYPYYQSEAAGRPVRPGMAEGVLSRFERYFISRYENADSPRIEAAREQLPFAIIRVKERDRVEQVMELHPRFDDPQASDRRVTAYGAFINDRTDWALLAPETTQPLLVSYATFR